MVKADSSLYHFVFAFSLAQETLAEPVLVNLLVSLVAAHLADSILQHSILLI